MKDDLGDRMKRNYEDRYRFKLTRRMPVIIRLDGKAFHTLTKGMIKPFDIGFISVMRLTALRLLEEIQGAKLAYVQSDEISLLLTDYDKLTTDAWFDYNIQKMCSISASKASVIFSAELGEQGLFDSRVFNLPKEEVTNYFIWRQKDWMRNSLSMLCQSYFSSKELHGKNRTEQQDLLHTKGINWAKLKPMLRNGSLFIKQDNIIEKHIDITKNRKLIEQFM